MKNSWNAICDINLIFSYSENFVLTAAASDGQVPTFVVTDTNPSVPAEILSTGNNVKLLLQLESDFKRATNWNEFKSNSTSTNPIFTGNLDQPGKTTMLLII